MDEVIEIEYKIDPDPKINGMINIKIDTKSDTTLSSPQILPVAWSTFCIFYSVLLVAIGAVFAMATETLLAIDALALEYFMEYYIILYSVSLALLLAQFLITGHLATQVSKQWRNIVHKLQQFLKLVYKYKSKPIVENNGNGVQQQQTNGIPATEKSADGPEAREMFHKPAGRLGLRLITKLSGLVFLVHILVEFTVFMQVTLQDPDCHDWIKGATFILQFFFAIFNTNYLLNNHKVSLHSNIWLANFNSAHLLGTTICTGFFLQVSDYFDKLYEIYGDVKSKEKAELLLKEHIHLPVWILEQRDGSNKTVCFFQQEALEMKQTTTAYTYIFSVFYIFGATFIHILLTLHYHRVQLQPQSDKPFWSFFKRLQDPNRSTSAQGTLSLSLIVASFAVSILAIGSEENILVHVYTLVLHTYATLFSLSVMNRLAKTLHHPDLRHITVEHIFIMFLYFGLILFNVCKHLASSLLEAHESGLEIAQSVVEVAQTLIHTVLILMVLSHKKLADLQEVKLPAELLTHLIAVNISTLVIGIFKDDGTAIEQSIFEQGGELMNVRLVWMALQSFLIPWSLFHRVYAIILLIDITKYCET